MLENMMRVPPSAPRPINHTQSAAQTTDVAVSKKQFQPQISAPKPSTSMKAMGAADIIADVKSLALEVKSGAITKEEASKRFVSLVIEKRHDLSSMGQKGKVIEEAVKEVAGDDPHFVASLSTQLQKLANS